MWVESNLKRQRVYTILGLSAYSQRVLLDGEHIASVSSPYQISPLYGLFTHFYMRGTIL
jgi:hypothetical protein